ARALGHAFGQRFGLATEDRDTEPLGVVGPLTVTFATPRGGGHAEAGHRPTVLCIALLWVATQIANDNHFAQTCHGLFAPPSPGLGSRLFARRRGGGRRRSGCRRGGQAFG